MSDLDGLINSKISLISQHDVKFDGTLYSINAEESSMVLKDGKGRINISYFILLMMLY